VPIKLSSPSEATPPIATGPKWTNESETGFAQRLSFFERVDCGSYSFLGRIALVPISKDSIAKVFIY